MQAWVLTQDYSLEKLPPLAGVHSLDDLSIHLPGGVYTTFRTYSRWYALSLEDHFARLEESAGLLGKAISINRASIRQALRQGIYSTDFEELRIRISIDTSVDIGEITLAVEELSVPSPKEYQAGVRVGVWTGGRANPRAKSSAFISTARVIRTNMQATGINEVLMADPAGNILEGLTSNFFGIKNGVLYTAEEGVLAGITRKVVLQVAQTLGIQTRLEPVLAAELSSLEEAFLSSSSRGVLPVAYIEDKVVGLECPGTLTLRIRQEYDDQVARSIELI
jgi:branched-chain amino acid aminotransferase